MAELKEHYKNKKGFKHGYYYEPWYVNYRCMMDRCYCKKVESYPQYGGSGVAVCEEWHDIRNFKKWAEESGYRPGLILDRIDGTKGYSPDNCRWATPKEQTNNRKNTIFLTMGNETLPLTVWSERLGINPHTLRDRITRRGWGHERALTEKVHRHGARMDKGDEHEAG